MSYTKQTWNTGDVITAQKLNHMEDGIGGGNPFFIINLTYDEKTSEPSVDKTNAEIWAAWQAGKIPMLIQRDNAYTDNSGEAQGGDQLNSILFVNEAIAVFSCCFVTTFVSTTGSAISVIEVKTTDGVQSIMYREWNSPYNPS